jgi:predicted phage baseplate assembly protein
VTVPGAGPPRLEELRADDSSERGRLAVPDLDDRRWQDLVDEAETLIRHYAPQWTDHNPSDIGMALIELFAWLVESLIYRLNRVPEKNYIAFLNLLGIRRAPKAPARTLLTFTATGNGAEVAAGTAAQTAGSETDEPIIFETDAPLTVVPVEVVGVVRVDDIARPTVASPAVLPDPTAMSLAPGESVQICIALDTEEPPLRGLDLHVEPVRPPRDRQAVERIEWMHSVAPPADPEAEERSERFGPWNRFDVLHDGTAGLVRPGAVRLHVAAGVDWTTQDAADWMLGSVGAPEGAHHWLGLRITNDSPPPVAGAPPPPPLVLRLDQVLPNTTSARSVGTVNHEVLGRGTGKPGQVVRLARWPLFARPDTDAPYEHLIVIVAGVVWHAVDSMPDGPGQFYLLDPVAGEITFGDGDQAPGRGSAPGADEEIVAERYRYVSAGSAGNVPAGRVTMLRHAAAAPHPVPLRGVTNPVPGFGGTDEEPIEETKRRAPETLRHRDRAVTADDYERLARTAAPGIAQVRCLPPRLHARNEPGGIPGVPWTYAKLQRALGVVNVLVVPDLGLDVPEPTASLALVQDVLRALDKRRPVGTALHVDGPRYVRVGVTARVAVFPSALEQGLVRDREQVFTDTAARIRRFLHPVHGRDGLGWRIGQSISISDLYQAVRPAEDVGFITSLMLTPEELAYFDGDDPVDQRPFPDPIGQDTPHVRIADYELVCPGTVTVGPPAGDSP